MRQLARDRWRVALHEASHGIFALRALGAERIEVAIRADNAGTCIAGDSTLRPGPSFELAVYCATGAQGERFARNTRPPRRPKQTKHSSAATAAADDEPTNARAVTVAALCGVGRPDDSYIAEWACMGNAMIEAMPAAWVHRARRCKANARLFVWRHRAEIVELARALFKTGYVAWSNHKQEGAP